MRPAKRTITDVAAKGGSKVTYRFDAGSLARLSYLIRFYEEVLGIKTSANAVIRRALLEMTGYADDLVQLGRVCPRSHELAHERLSICQAAEGHPAPSWGTEFPALPSGRPFPTFKGVACISGSPAVIVTPQNDTEAA
jgi:hypothetical protein